MTLVFHPEPALVEGHWGEVLPEMAPAPLGWAPEGYNWHGTAAPTGTAGRLLAPPLMPGVPQTGTL